MKSTRICRACRRSFEVDSRNAHRHSHCSRAACQRARRTLAQKQRRQQKAHAQASSWLHQSFSRLQGDKILAEQPLFIGLISMVTGSTDRVQLQEVLQRLCSRGRDILGIGLQEAAKPPGMQAF